jgi:hypothetical protein
MTCTNCQKKKQTVVHTNKAFKANVQQLIENIKKQRVKGYSNGKTEEK